MNHYKYLKLLSSVILVGGVSAVAAESAKPFSNFYVGVGTGYSIFNGRSVSAAGVSNHKQLHSQGFMGKIMGGYEVFSVSNIYGAVEGYFMFDPQSSTFECGTPTTALDQEKFSRKMVFGARGKLGTSFNETMLVYGILGAEASCFTVEGMNNGTKSTRKKFLWAAVPGAGLGIPLSEKTKMMIEYTYARYQVFNSQWTYFGSSYGFKVRPSVNTISVGVSWSL